MSPDPDTSCCPPAYKWNSLPACGVPRSLRFTRGGCPSLGGSRSPGNQSGILVEVFYHPIRFSYDPDKDLLAWGDAQVGTPRLFFTPMDSPWHEFLRETQGSSNLNPPSPIRLRPTWTPLLQYQDHYDLTPHDPRTNSPV